VKVATLTAQILVGSPHPNHDGINPTHFLFLSENDRPAWMLVQENVFEENRGGAGRITWIPTVEDMLEDALLMIAIHVAKNREVVELARSFNSRIEMDKVALPSVLEEIQRRRLYLKCRSILDFPKLVISVFRGSTIDKQLSVLEEYKMDVEVCRVGYSRLSSPWASESTTGGSLT
jgi:hypothetical protein